MATMNSGPGAILTPDVSVEDLYAAEFMTRDPKGLTASEMEVSGPGQSVLSPNYSLAAEPLDAGWRIDRPCLNLASRCGKNSDEAF